MAFTSIRVMTYNVNRCQGGAKEPPLDAVFGVIAAAAPDVVALQEIDCSPDGPLTRLASRLGMRHYSFGGAVDGNAFLSYYPLHGVESHPIGRESSCLRADLDLGQKRMSLLNIRIKSCREDGPRLEELFGADFLGGRRGGIPSLLLGDFGLSLVDPTWRCQRFSSPLQRLGRPLLHGTYPASLPLICRDRAYILGDLQSLGVGVVRDALARRASSHLPLLVTVRIIDPRLYLKVEAPLPSHGLEAAAG